MPKKKSKPYDSVCIGGAGVRGLVELGSLHYFYANGLIDPSVMRTYVGSSVGAAISLLLLVGYTPIEIFQYVSKIDKWIDFSAIDITGFMKEWGLFDINEMLKHCETLVERKLRFVPTLKQLYEYTGKRFVACVVNVSKNRVEYVDYQSDPDLGCVKAASMSCAIPLIFKRVEYKGNFYVDGGLLDNLPVKALDPKSRALIIGVTEKLSKNTTETMLGYLHALTAMPIMCNQRLTIENLPKNHPHTLVCVVLENAPVAVDFNLGKSKKLELFGKGYDVAEEVMLAE